MRSLPDGGGSNFPPSLVIIQSYANVINRARKFAGQRDPEPEQRHLARGNIASYSSRGPDYSYNALKPDISAPGTVVAAAVGTGNGQSSEDGTSFATPLTLSGSTALLLSQNHTLGPLDIKALLMETSNTAVFNNTATQPGVLTPMSRMGAGGFRVDHATAASTAVWDASDPLAVSLSFSAFRLNAGATYKKKVVVRNYSASARTYTITNTYRAAPNTTGVTIAVPSGDWYRPTATSVSR